MHDSRVQVEASHLDLRKAAFPYISLVFEHLSPTLPYLEIPLPHRVPSANSGISGFSALGLSTQGPIFPRYWRFSHSLLKPCDVFQIRNRYFPMPHNYIVVSPTVTL